jgi:hypothetical protein
MQKTRDILAELKTEIPAMPSNNRPWWERAPREHAATLAAIHAAWHRGELGSRKSTAARAIASKLQTLDITIGSQGVLAWLRLPPQS